MTKTVKILIILFGVVFTGALGFTAYWTITNWDKVASGMSGANLYTQDDITKAYQDGYDTALKNKVEYENLIAEYLDELVTLNVQVGDLAARVNQLTQSDGNKAAEIAALTASINTKTARITELENAVNTLEMLLTAWENSNKYVVNFLVGGAVSSVQIVDPAISSYVNTPLQPYGDFVFVGWSLDGVNIINPTTILINAHTNFTAILNYTATFKSDGVNYGTAQVVSFGGFASKPTDPTKADNNFVGWSVDGINLVDVTTYPITQNTIFGAVWVAKDWATVYERITGVNSRLYLIDGWIAKATVNAPADQNTHLNINTVSGRTLTSPKFRLTFTYAANKGDSSTSIPSQRVEIVLGYNQEIVVTPYTNVTIKVTLTSNNTLTIAITHSGYDKYLSWEKIEIWQ